MNKFKVGDTVLCVNGWPPVCVEGHCYVVTGCSTCSTGFLRINSLRDDKEGGFSPARFVPITLTKVERVFYEI